MTPTRKKAAKKGAARRRPASTAAPARPAAAKRTPKAKKAARKRAAGAPRRAGTDGPWGAEPEGSGPAFEAHAWQLADPVPDARGPLQAAAWLPAPDAAAPMHLRPSPRAAAATLAKIVAFAAFVLSMPLVVAILTGNGAAFVATALAAQFGILSSAPVVLGMLLPALRLVATRYAIDADGVRVTSNLLARTDQRVTWDKVTLLRQRRGLVERVLGIETLDVVAYGARGVTLHLVGLRGAASVRDYAARQMRASASVANLLRGD